MSKALNSVVMLMADVKRTDNAVAELEEKVTAMYMQAEFKMREAMTNHAKIEPQYVSAQTRLKVVREMMALVVNFRESLQ